jgi:hypothetical protein
MISEGPLPLRVEPEDRPSRRDHKGESAPTPTLRSLPFSSQGPRWARTRVMERFFFESQMDSTSWR